MEFKDILAARRSTRKFADEPLQRAQVEKLMRMALTAPSAKNTRSTHLIAVDDRATLAAMAAMRDSGSAFMAGAAAAVVVAGDGEASDMWVENCSIVASYLQLAAVDEGLASCWVHVRGRLRRHDEPAGATAEAYLRELLHVPATWNVECVIALGRSDFHPAALPPYNSDEYIGWSK